MSAIPPLQFLGIITKTHGIKGGLVLRSEEILSEEIEKTELVFVEFDQLPVPFFIEEAELLSPHALLFQFSQIGSPLLPSDFTQHKVFIPEKRKKKKAAVTELSSLEGYRVVDEHKGELGIVTEITGVERNPLMKIQRGKNEILIPASEPIILGIDPRKRIVYIDAPEGLIDLYLE
jgi:16S rRNA processing protein RimM